MLVTIARDPAARLRDVALVCALTERTVQAIVADLESDGYLRRARDGRRNRYEISAGAMFRHPAEAGVQVAGLLALLTGAAPAGGSTGAGGAERADGAGGFEAEPPPATTGGTPGAAGGEEAWAVGAPSGPPGVRGAGGTSRR
ncbi:MarR family transcriptional regulator [Streptomyces sp. NBC_00158]|uniref:MarR family transcriptional regulator n=1 Tax=Streptomyces sp. NBC_00158 TaxID=2903627 RepID=UPI0038678B16